MPSTFSALHHHIIFSTKERKRLLIPPLVERMHEYLGGCVRTLSGIALEVGGVSDHVHLLVRLKPTHCVADLLCDVKKASSKWVRGEMGQRFFHWQDGYAAFTVSPSQIERLRRYIAKQPEHHRVKTFEEEYREFLNRHGVEFDERYLF